MFHFTGKSGEIEIKVILYAVLEFQAKFCGFIITIFTGSIFTHYKFQFN